MSSPKLNIVTGAFGYIGKYITERLLQRGERVKTLTAHPNRPHPFGNQVEALPFNFEKPAALAKSLEGASTLYNTYWVRFDYRNSTFDKAVENSLTLFKVAKEAGIQRIVHISITNPGEDSPLPYFKGKAILERALKESGVSYAIIRPTVLFGHRDILINNIAWFLRKFPLFVVPGSGKYKIQPVYVEDVADLAVKAGYDDANLTIDAIGPEIYTYEQMVRLIAETIGRKVRIVHFHPFLTLIVAKITNFILRDVVLTKEEIKGLMAGLLVSQEPPTGKISFSRWLKENRNTVGKRYASELHRHFM